MNETKTYELAYLLSPLVAEEMVVGSQEKLRAAIEGAGATIKDEARPQIRPLAYPVSKFEQAWFGHIKIIFSPEKVNELKNILGKVENIVRFELTVAGPDMPPPRPRISRTFRSVKKPVEKMTAEAVAAVDREIEELIK